MNVKTLHEGNNTAFKDNREKTTDVFGQIPFSRRKQTIVFERPPFIVGRMSVAGTKEGKGPIGKYIRKIYDDDKLHEKTFEKAESKLQELALDTAKRKLGVSYEDIDLLFAGDLLNQCISSSFAARGTSGAMAARSASCSPRSPTVSAP